MNQQTADAKDRAWDSRDKERQVWYKVGSVFKACKHCGSFDVFRTFKPHAVGFTHYCYNCSSKDEQCW
jgi:hypothetical protein